MRLGQLNHALVVGTLSELFIGFRLLDPGRASPLIGHTVFFATVSLLIIQNIAFGFLFVLYVGKSLQLVHFITLVMLNLCRSMTYVSSALTMRKHAHCMRSVFAIFKKHHPPLRSTIFFFVALVSTVAISVYGSLEKALRITGFTHIESINFTYLLVFTSSTIPFLVLVPICTTMMVCRSLLIASYLRVRQCKHHSDLFLISRKLPRDIGEYVRGVVALNEVFSTSLLCWILLAVFDILSLFVTFFEHAACWLSHPTICPTAGFKTINTTVYILEIVLIYSIFDCASWSSSEYEWVSQEVFWGASKAPPRRVLEADLLLKLLSKKHAITVFDAFKVNRGLIYQVVATSFAYVVIGLQLDPSTSEKVAHIEKARNI